MSVIVKDMEMPEDCWDCGMGCQGMCYLMGNIWDGTNRPDWCPLVELPEKHGRLIDADDYAAEMKKRQDNAMVWREEAARNNDMVIIARADQAITTFSEAKLTLDAMETIVEAEGD